MQLSRKTSFLIITIIASLLIGTLIGFYFYERNANKPTTFLGGSTVGKSIGYNPNSNTTFTAPSSLGPDFSSGTTSVPTIPKLRHITTQPVSGSGFAFINVYSTSTTQTTFSLPPGKNVEPPDSSLSLTVTKKIPPKLIRVDERVRYIERATGHIFETSTSSDETTRLSNTTITRIQESFFTGTGDALLLRDLLGSTDTIRTRYAVLTLDTPTSTEQTLRLTEDLSLYIDQLAFSPDRTQLFSILNNGARGVLSKVDGSSKVTLFDSPFKEWLVQWPNKAGITLTTKPSSGVAGFAYLLNPQTKAFSRLLGDINGLTTLTSPDLSKVLYSESGDGNVGLFMYNVKTGATSPLFFHTLPEKCAWSPVDTDIVYCAVPESVSFNSYPDAWYQGLINFSDNIWSLNVSTGETKLIVTPIDETGSIIDVMNLSISTHGDYLIFQNKTDLSLWGLRLKELLN